MSYVGTVRSWNRSTMIDYFVSWEFVLAATEATTAVPPMPPRYLVQRDKNSILRHIVSDIYLNNWPRWGGRFYTNHSLILTQTNKLTNMVFSRFFWLESNSEVTGSNPSSNSKADHGQILYRKFPVSNYTTLVLSALIGWKCEYS